MPLPRALSLFGLSSTSPSSSASDAGASAPPDPSTSTSAGAGPSDKQRQRRAQKKKAARARRRESRLPVDEDADEADEVEADEAPVAAAPGAGEDGCPDADEDTAYLEEWNRAQNARVAQAHGAGRENAPLRNPDDDDDEAATGAPSPEAIKQALRRRADEAKARKAAAQASKPLGPLPSGGESAFPVRVSLPPGAGQVEGVGAIRSTLETRRKIEQAGFVPLTDEDGMLRMGVRVARDMVLVHQAGAGEPIVLKM
ncbi:hypothetical protein JCM10207_007053 [Rhodosporidiobolus poonsookiae]